MKHVGSLCILIQVVESDLLFPHGNVWYADRVKGDLQDWYNYIYLTFFNYKKELNKLNTVNYNPLAAGWKTEAQAQIPMTTKILV